MIFIRKVHTKKRYKKNVSCNCLKENCFVPNSSLRGALIWGRFTFVKRFLKPWWDAWDNKKKNKWLYIKCSVTAVYFETITSNDLKIGLPLLSAHIASFYWQRTSFATFFYSVGNFFFFSYHINMILVIKICFDHVLFIIWDG